MIVDKWNFSVVMKNKDYMTYLNNMLRNGNTYQVLSKDLTSKYQFKANDSVNELKQNKIINDKETRQLKIYNAIPSKIYGLRKTHKDTLILRLRVSCISAPYKNLEILI